MANSGPVRRERGKKGVSDVYLIVDSRERSVIPFLDAALQEHAHIEKQVNTGDYLICRKESGGGSKILACIERKTHEDFAASFKDGRYENFKKMLALRKATGCQLYVFVEGPAFPSPTSKFSRIPFGNILAAITNLMVRDGIFAVQTKDECNSAKRLADFLHAFDKETPYVADEAAQAVQAGEAVQAVQAGEAVQAAQAAEAAQEAQADDTALAIPDILVARVEKSDDDSASYMWARLQGITVVLGKLLTREFTVADLASQKVTPERIKALKAATGRPIAKTAIESLLAVRSGSFDHAVKLVSGLKNVTPAIASLILKSAGGLSRLCSQPVEFLAAVEIPQKNRTVKLGKIRAERIRRILHYMEGSDPPENDSGHVLGENPEPVILPDEDVLDVLTSAGFA